MAASAAGSGSAPCIDTSMTASTWRAATNCLARSRASSEPASMSTTCLPAASNSRLAARTTVENIGSSETSPAGGSETITAMESVRRVTRLRAAGLGMYPSSFTTRMTRSRMSAATVGSPFTTLETVDLDTPARVATASSVGRLMWSLPQCVPPGGQGCRGVRSHPPRSLSVDHEENAPRCGSGPRRKFSPDSRGPARPPRRHATATFRRDAFGPGAAKMLLRGHER
ncbi:hypothetical protein GCM10017559_19490 [Streptosporangium longisporum]|uniref:Uncharacterized protein n=1 Tax=Streptosporangium longisporum TaxID=46187 RepID=A0ABN3XVY6_9ACTN